MTATPQQPTTTAQPEPTCWSMWLKNRAEFCPFLPNLTEIAPDIEFLERLSAGGHSYIVKVQLQGRIYVLKLFKLLPAQWSLRKFELHALQYDPFILECRVYDLLMEHGKLGTVGPHCFGWLTISRDQERELDEKLRFTFDWTRMPSTENDPVRCLLLEYIEGCQIDTAYLTPPGAESLRKQLDFLHSLNIAHGDFLPRNIMVANNGQALLIDFSSAILWPVSNAIHRKKEDFQQYMDSENGALELLLFRLQRLKRHQGLVFSKATSEENAYGSPIHTWVDLKYKVSDF